MVKQGYDSDGLIADSPPTALFASGSGVEPALPELEDVYWIIEIARETAEFDEE
jgi:hypothetical protein